MAAPTVVSIAAPTMVTYAAPLQCRGWTSETGSELGYGGYPDSTASSGPQCMCEARPSEFENGPHYVDQARFYGTDPEPYRISYSTPLGDATGRNPVRDGGYWVEIMRHFTRGAAYELDDSSWVGWLSRVDADGNRIDCEDYPEPVFNVAAEEPSSPPPPMGAEPEQECRPGAPVKTRLRLHYAPLGKIGKDELVEAIPLYISGDPRFRGATIEELKVLSWSGVRHIDLHGADSFGLEKGEGSLFEFGKDAAWLGSARFRMNQSEVSIFDAVDIEVKGTCPTKRPPPVHRGPAYTLSGEKLPPSMRVSSESSLTLRLVEDGAGSPRRFLMIEAPGTPWHRGVVLQVQPDNRWRFDHVEGDFEIAGTFEERDDGAILILEEVSIGGMSIQPANRRFELRRAR